MPDWAGVPNLACVALGEEVAAVVVERGAGLDGLRAAARELRLPLVLGTAGFFFHASDIFGCCLSAFCLGGMFQISREPPA